MNTKAIISKDVLITVAILASIVTLISFLLNHAHNHRAEESRIKKVLQEHAFIVPVEITNIHVTFSKYSGKVIYTIKNKIDNKTTYEYQEHGSSSNGIDVRKFDYALIGFNPENNQHSVIQPSNAQSYEKQKPYAK